MTTTLNLYRPPDIHQANNTWKASCGPAALAALLQRPAMECRDLFPGFRGWCNPTMMGDAVRLSGRSWQECKPIHWPLYGPVWIQFEGPWEGAGVPPGAAYKFTHWIACHDSVEAMFIYDVNADGWLTAGEWQEEIMPLLQASHKRCTGWRLRKTWEVSR